MSKLVKINAFYARIRTLTKIQQIRLQLVFWSKRYSVILLTASGRPNAVSVGPNGHDFGVPETNREKELGKVPFTSKGARGCIAFILCIKCITTVGK